MFLRRRDANPSSAKSQAKSTSSNLVYNANRYSPKTTARGPTASSALYSRSNRTLVRRKKWVSSRSITVNFSLERHSRAKRQSANSGNTSALRAFNHSHENTTRRLTTADKAKIKERQSSITTSNEDRKRKYRLKRKRHSSFISMKVTIISTPTHPSFWSTCIFVLLLEHASGDEDEIQLKTTIDPLFSTRSINMSKSVELHRLTTSVETMRTSVLQAYVSAGFSNGSSSWIRLYRYLDLHEKFAKTTELQTSALTALWKRVFLRNSSLNYSTD